MPFTSEQLELIDQTGEVLIETRDRGRTYRTIIWVVVDNGDVFVRSVRGDSGKWYQRVLDDPEVALLVDGARIPAVAVAANDDESIERTSRALADKYPAGGSLDAMLAEDVLGTTLRLEPA